MQLDIRTVFAVCALCTVLAAIAILAGIAGEDRRRSGSGLVGLAALFIGAGLGLNSTRGLLNPWISIFLANAVLCSGALLFWTGLRRLYELPGRPFVVALLLAMLMTVDAAFLLTDQADSVKRSICASLLIALTYALPTVLVVRQSNQWLGRAHYVVGGAFLAESGALVARAAWGMLGPPAAQYSILSPHPMNVAFALILLANVVLVSYGFLLMLRERELLTLAMLDGLTGVMNRRAMNDAMESALAMAQRGGRECAVLLLDLDHFKRVNDEHGHAAGDLVLQRFAAQVAGLIRCEDVLGRYGGEEFAVLLTGTSGEGALVFARRLQQALAAQPVRLAKGELRVTASVGISPWRPGAAADLARLLKEADQAMYAAKALGRDRAVLAGAPAQPQADAT